MSSLLPPNLNSTLAELRKRVERLELSTRVPSVSRGGVQGSVGTNGQLNDPGPVDNALLDGQTETDGIDLTTTIGASGRLLVIFGAVISAGSLGVTGWMRPWFPDLDPQPTDALVYLPSGDTAAYCTTARVLDGLPAGDLRVQARYGKSDGGFIASFSDPFLAAFPIG